MEAFDYVIVGAGSAGCLIANRLSRDPALSVCLIEAGRPDSSPSIDMPIGVLKLIGKRDFNWYFDTEPQLHLNGRKLFWPRGKTLGGSSAINGMVYVRGAAEDYDEWEALGAKGWGWSKMLPYFQRHEHNERGADAFHGEGGELNVAPPANRHPLGEAFLRAAAEWGLSTNADFNGERQEGAGHFQVTLKRGRRISSARAFLDPVKHRSNLTILTDAHALRVLLEDRRATGVEVRIEDEIRRISAKRETILSGGALNSPQLLLLSGIGAGSAIVPHGLALIHELPGVGHNLQDHLGISILMKDRTRTSPGLAPGIVPAIIKGYFDYRRTGTGLFATTTETGAFVKLAPDSARAEVQLHFMPGKVKDHGRKATFGYGMMLNCCQLRPKSRGFVALHSAEPLAAPAIQPNYLDHPDDLAELLAGLKVGREILQAPAMQRVTGGVEVAPGAGAQSDDELADYVRREANSIYHPVGTCRMGHDEEAVVDERLRVHGIAGLRVADASIMPRIVGGNTNAPVMAIAEKAAEMILNDLRLITRAPGS